MDKKNKKKKIIQNDELSRREFLIAGGTMLAGSVVATSAATELLAETPSTDKYPKAKGHIEHDSKKCSGCLTCAIACSLAHDGEINPAKARLQISRYVFDDFPNDIMGYACQQCDEPGCVAKCPVKACYIDTKNGNVRTIDKNKCIGCKTCLKACNLTPHRTVWNAADKKSSKCDLCANVPYNKEQKGSPICVAVCPQKALKFVES